MGSSLSIQLLHNDTPTLRDPWRICVFSTIMHMAGMEMYTA